MTETIETTEEQGLTVSVLEMWQSILGNAEPTADEPVPIGVAAALRARWPFLEYREMQRYQRVYHHILTGCLDILNDIIASDPLAFDFVGDEDAEHNHEHYLDALVQWHVRLEDYEENWRCEEPDSHLWVAAIPEARQFLFANVGFAGHLDAIGFALPNDVFMDALTQFMEERGE